ncbi:MAG: universal stress protein [Armatimonadetes bacterium]|nr:universal stress protein [Armatimonadota bacterium]
MPIDKALVPVDGSEVSMEAVRLAAELAPKQGWDVVLLHAIEQPPMPGYAFPKDVREEALRVLAEEAGAVLADAEKPLAEAGVKTETKLVHGSPSDAVVQQIDESCCGIVIMGSIGIGRGKLGALLLGSVAEQVVHRVRIPVLLVREKQVER